MSRLTAVLFLWAEHLLRYVDQWRFNASRADYYDYLGALLQGMQGRRTLREIFDQDAFRYGDHSPRGRLSRQWAVAFQVTGGDLHTTWLGCFPLSELSLIRVAQASGNAPLIHTLQDLSKVLLLVQQTKRILASTLWSAGVAMLMLAVMVMAVPLFTVPRLQQIFSAVPTHYYAALTRALFDFAVFVQANWFVLAGSGLVAGALLLWSLPNLTGRARRYLDGRSLWKIYRCIHAMRFLAVLSIVLARQGSNSTQLRTALALQRPGASAWQAWHINSMLGRIDIGLTGAQTFDTGLLDRELFWFFSDMTMARGLHEGLQLTQERLKNTVLTSVATQALVLRWGLLLMCVAGLLGLGLWHYAVIDELRRSLMLFYASQ